MNTYILGCFKTTSPVSKVDVPNLNIFHFVGILIYLPSSFLRGIISVLNIAQPNNEHKKPNYPIKSY